MVATKKSNPAQLAKPKAIADSANTAGADAAPKKAGWAKPKSTPAPAAEPAQTGALASAGGAPAAAEQEFDPSRIARSLNAGSASAIPASAEENAQFEASQSELAGQAGRPSTVEGEATEQQGDAPATEAAAPAGKKQRVGVNKKKVASAGDPTTLESGVVDTNTAKELVGIVERMERMAEEISGIRDDMKEELGMAKSRGYSTAMIRKVIAARAQDPEKRRQMQALFETYMNAVGEDV